MSTLRVHHDGQVLLSKSQYFSLGSGQKVILLFPDLKHGVQRLVYRVEEIPSAMPGEWVGKDGDFLQIRANPKGFSFSGGDGRAFALRSSF